MLELRQSTEVIVPIGAFVDVGDGFTPQTDIALSCDEAELLKHGSVAVVDISGATWAAITSCRGWYGLTLTAALTDTLGILKVIVQDDSDCLPVHAEFLVVTQQYWDSKYSTDVRQVDVTQIGGDAQSLADFKDLADTGYNPATHKLAGVVLADTCTTSTDMRGTDGVDTAAMRGTDSAALATALATHDGKLDTADEVVDAALAILKADKVIDTGEDPWELVLYTQGAEQIPENEIFRKALSQPDGTAVSSSDHIVGQEEHTT